jgi:hypothetical protein
MCSHGLPFNEDLPIGFDAANLAQVFDLNGTKALVSIFVAFRIALHVF